MSRLVERPSPFPPGRVVTKRWKMRSRFSGGTPGPSSVTVTSAREPIVDRGWLAPGTHVNAVGSSIPTARELDSATIAAAALFVDRRESTVNESGEYLRAVEEEGIGPDHIRAELGEVLVGSAAGRDSDEELTVFVSLGLAVEDLAAAEYLYRRARSEGVGAVVPF